MGLNSKAAQWLLKKLVLVTNLSRQEKNFKGPHITCCPFFIYYIMIKSFSQYNNISKFLLLVVIMLISTVCVSPIALLAGDAITRLGGSVSSVLKSTQVISAIGVMIIPSFVFIFLINEKPGKYLSISKLFTLKQFILTSIVYLTSIPFITWLTIMNQNIVLPEKWHWLESYILESEQKIEILTYQMLDLSSPYSWITNFIVVALVAGIAEEILFRGTLQRLLCSSIKRIWLAILITNIIFSFIHFQFYGFIPRLALGIIFSIIVLRTDNLWLAIYAHILNNTMALIEVHYEMKNTLIDCVSLIKPTYSIFIYIISFIIMLFTLSKLKTNDKE